MCKIKAKSWKQHYGNGRCSAIGCNDTDLDTLTWHHRDPSTKLFTPSKLTCKVGATEPWATGRDKFNWERAKAEIDKCDLLCPICHMELHRAIQLAEAGSKEHVTKEFWRIFDNVEIEKYNPASRPEQFWV